jgi:archaeal flagellar protein FlaI
MKLKLPVIRKKEQASQNPSPQNIARRFKRGYKAKNHGHRKGDARVYYERGAAPLFQADMGSLKIELSERKQESGSILKEGNVESGVALPSDDIFTAGMKFSLPGTTDELRSIESKYPLIPQTPKEGETVFAYAHVLWDEKAGGLVYNVVEPQISAEDRKLVEAVKKDIEERLDVDFSKLGDIKAKELLSKEVRTSLGEFPLVDKGKIPMLQYFIEKEIFGLGVIEPLMKDGEIEDISCDGERVPIYIYHRNPNFGPLRTNLWFDNSIDLDSFILKLAQKCGKSISVADPLLDAALPDGSRVQCTMGTDIARRGSNFTIRKFTAYPLTPTHFLHYGTVNSMQLAYLWLAIDNGKSILISGGTATGKTSLLNALSLFIRPNLKILSIEDTPELRLPHMHWVPEVARSPLSVKGKVGEVTLFDLLRSSLRQRPDYLVVGEVRGKEAFVLFQQMATGHPSLATIHAASLTQLVDRLVTPPISLPPALIENVDILIFVQRVKVKGKDVRRVNEIVEITGLVDEKPTSAKIFEWSAIKDDFIPKNKSKILEEIAKMTGVTEVSVQAELLRRKKVLEWLFKKGVYDYNEVGRIVSEYYQNPDKVTTMMEEGE